MKALHALALLWAFGGVSAAGKAPAAALKRSFRTPEGLPLPSSHGYSVDYLLNDQAFQPAPPSSAQKWVPDPDEEAWRKFALDPKRPGPRVQDDTRPGSRRLNAFERWALSPYFIDEDLTAVISNGVLPSFIDKSKLPPGADPSNVPVSMHAMTFTAKGASKPAEIWLPRFRPQLWRRWDLSLLAHELTHGAQGRMGGQTPEQLRDMMLKYGYEDSPTEVQARHWQGGVLRRLDERRAAFYAGK